MFIARKVSIKSIINSQSLYIEYGNLFTYLNISKIVVHRKSIGVVIQKYIKRKLIQLQEIYIQILRMIRSQFL